MIQNNKLKTFFFMFYQSKLKSTKIVLKNKINN